MGNRATTKKRQDDLIRAVVEEFIPMFAPGGTVLYREDRNEKLAGLDAAAFGELGISDLNSDRMPDVIIHHAAKNHLILIDTVPGLDRSTPNVTMN